MNIAALKIEDVAGHPDTGEYDVDVEIAAGQMNAVNRSLNRPTMTASEVYNAIVPAAYTALTADEKEEVWNILHLGVINPFGLEATRMTAIFGAGSDTITALAALRKTSVSRADEIGLGFVWPAQITQARAYHG